MIPIENVYYLLSYAARDVHQFPLRQRGNEPFTTIAEVLVHALTVRMERVVKHGLERNYIATESEIPGVRGRLEVTQTVSRLLTRQGRTYCRFDEFEADILPNRLIKAALKKSLLLKELSGKIRDRARRVVLDMRVVSEIPVRDADFSRLAPRFNNRDYPFALRLARLILANMLVNERTGAVQFHDFRRDEREMARIFEEFLFRFYERQARATRVRRPHIEWHEVEASETDKAFLPIMRTDIVMEDRARLLIIDAKYYQEALKGWHGTERVRSSNLYQILAYVENAQFKYSKRVEGMLLYPVVSAPFAFDYVINGRPIRIRSIDLNQPWDVIHHELLGLLR